MFSYACVVYCGEGRLGSIYYRVRPGLREWSFGQFDPFGMIKDTLQGSRDIAMYRPTEPIS